MLISQVSYGIEDNHANKVYIIVTNRLTLTDIEIMDNLKKLIDEGSIGLMNVRGTTGYKGPESFMTINSSRKAYATNESSQFFSLNSENRKLYENRNGLLNGDFAIGNLGIGKLYNVNKKNTYVPYIGALGDNLHKAGFKTAVFGNSDTPEEFIRTASLIPMDSKGLIDYGNIDNITMEDIRYPFSIKTDYKKILNEITNDASLTVIDTGDLERLHLFNDVLSDEHFMDMRNLILKDIDSFIGNLVSLIDKENSLVIVTSPNSGEERVDANKLAPIILWGRNISRSIATSGTTNRQGVVSNLDISPTILNFLNEPADNMTGNPIEIIGRNDNLSNIIKMSKQINVTSKVRFRTLLTYGVLCMIGSIIPIVFLLAKIRISTGIKRKIKGLLQLLYGIPLIFLMVSLFKPNSTIKYIFVLITLVLIYTGIIWCLKGKNVLFYISVLNIIFIFLDLILKGELSRYSVLSHDPIIGARYFGIGNEMVGILLGSVSIIAGYLFNKYSSRILPICLFFISIVVVGHPKLGANVGGTMALIIAFLYYIMEVLNKNINIRSLAIIGTTIIIVILIMGYIDIKINPNPTHLGKTLVLLKEDGLSVANNIIFRKILMNIKLIGSSFWTNLLLLDITIYTLLFNFFNIKENSIGTNILMGLMAGIAGSIGGFLLNDSGIILSALSMNMLTILLIFKLIDEGTLKKQEVK
jgi:hypothetical protein